MVIDSKALAGPTAAARISSSSAKEKPPRCDCGVVLRSTIEPLGVGKRRGAKQQHVEQRVHRGVHADAEREGDERDGGEAGGGEEAADGVVHGMEMTNDG